MELIASGGQVVDTEVLDEAKWNRIKRAIGND